jgi:hypothetical protein
VDAPAPPEPVAVAATEIVLPPWLLGSRAPEPLRTAAWRARWLLAAYWLLTLSGYAVLGAMAVGYWRGGAAVLTTVLTLGLTSLAGVMVGNVAALVRGRVWMIHLGVGFTLFGSCLLVPVLGVGTLWVVTFLWSVASGYHSLQRRFSLWALWVPVVCWGAGLLTLAERGGGLRRWQAGDKSAFWNLPALALLLTLVVLFLLYLAAQEDFHARVWRAEAGHARARLQHHGTRDRVRLTGRGLVALLSLALLVSGATALLSPYLFRTAPQQGQPRDRDAAHDRPPPRDREPPREPPRFDGEGLMRALRRAARQARDQGRDLLPFVPLFLLNRPLRRWWLLRRLRRPIGSVPPSERASRLWRYVTIALGDLDMAPRAGETVEDVAARVDASRRAQGLSPVRGLAESAERYARIRYGLGIPSDAVDALQRDAEAAFADLRATLPLRRRVTAWWRRIG